MTLRINSAARLFFRGSLSISRISRSRQAATEFLPTHFENMYGSPTLYQNYQLSISAGWSCLSNLQTYLLDQHFRTDSRLEPHLRHFYFTFIALNGRVFPLYRVSKKK